MLFARFDWFLNLGISSAIHLLATSRGKKCRVKPISSENKVTIWKLLLNLCLYILKQLFASGSVNSGGYLPRWSGSVNIHPYSPPLRRIIVNYQDSHGHEAKRSWLRTIVGSGNYVKVTQCSRGDFVWKKITALPLWLLESSTPGRETTTTTRRR